LISSSPLQIHESLSFKHTEGRLITCHLEYLIKEIPNNQFTKSQHFLHLCNKRLPLASIKNLHVICGSKDERNLWSFLVLSCKYLNVDRLHLCPPQSHYSRAFCYILHVQAYFKILWACRCRCSPFHLLGHPNPLAPALSRPHPVVSAGEGTQSFPRAFGCCAGGPWAPMRNRTLSPSNAFFKKHCLALPGWGQLGMR
jgi:hypothetical protein